MEFEQHGLKTRRCYRRAGHNRLMRARRTVFGDARVWLLVVMFLAGLVHGTRAPARARRSRLVATDLAIALIIAIATAAGAWLLDTHPLGLGDDETTFNRILSATFVGLAFIIGAWISDLALTRRARRLTRRRHRQRSQD